MLLGVSVEGTQAVLASSLRLPGGLLGLPWGFFGASWEPLGGFLGLPGGNLGPRARNVHLGPRRLGPLLEPSWGPLGPSWGPSWLVFWALLGHRCAILWISWDILDPQEAEQARAPKLFKHPKEILDASRAPTSPSSNDVPTTEGDQGNGAACSGSTSGGSRHTEAFYRPEQFDQAEVGRGKRGVRR